MLHFEFFELRFVSCCVYVGDFRWDVNTFACSDRACGTFWELNDFIAVFNRLNSIGREGLVLNVRDLGT